MYTYVFLLHQESFDMILTTNPSYQMEVLQWAQSYSHGLWGTWKVYVTPIGYA
jgi:hypothetical protein